jgi:hypothetical protein
MYVLEQRDDDFFVILHENGNFTTGYVGKVGKRYRVSRSYLGDDVDIGLVNSPKEAVSVFEAHYNRYPPKWVRVNDAFYTKDTHFGGPDVKRDEHGAWVAYRGSGCLLLRDNKRAVFATREEAQRVADLHENEGYENSVSVNDGYSWEVEPGIDEWLAKRGRTRTSSIAAAAA